MFATRIFFFLYQRHFFLSSVWLPQLFRYPTATLSLQSPPSQPQLHNENTFFSPSFGSKTERNHKIYIIIIFFLFCVLFIPLRKIDEKNMVYMNLLRCEEYWKKLQSPSNFFSEHRAHSQHTDTEKKCITEKNALENRFRRKKRPIPHSS